MGRHIWRNHSDLRGHACLIEGLSKLWVIPTRIVNGVHQLAVSYWTSPLSRSRSSVNQPLRWGGRGGEDAWRRDGPANRGRARIRRGRRPALSLNCGMAGTLRGSMDASEYKRVVMGLIFLIDVKRWKLVFETAILVERTKRSASRATMEA